MEIVDFPDGQEAGTAAADGFSGKLGRWFGVSLENIRNRSSKTHDDGHEYRSANPLRNADPEKQNIDEAGKPSSDGYEAEMTPSQGRS